MTSGFIGNRGSRAPDRAAWSQYRTAAGTLTRAGRGPTRPNATADDRTRRVRRLARHIHTTHKAQGPSRLSKTKSNVGRTCRRVESCSGEADCRTPTREECIPSESCLTASMCQCVCVAGSPLGLGQFAHTSECESTVYTYILCQLMRNIGVVSCVFKRLDRTLRARQRDGAAADHPGCDTINPRGAWP